MVLHSMERVRVSGRKSENIDNEREIVPANQMIALIMEGYWKRWKRYFMIAMIW